jgi:hypothetical protein
MGLADWDVVLPSEVAGAAFTADSDAINEDVLEEGLATWMEELEDKIGAACGASTELGAGAVAEGTAAALDGGKGAGEEDGDGDGAGAAAGAGAGSGSDGIPANKSVWAPFRNPYSPL